MEGVLFGGIADYVISMICNVVVVVLVIKVIFMHIKARSLFG